MLTRVTYALVIVAVGTLVGGFFTEESNVLLFVSIGLSVAAIVLVLVGWARRARQAPAFETEAGEEEALLEALDEEELAFVEERRPRRASRPKRPAARSKAKPKPKAKPRSSGTRRRASTAAKPRPARKSKPASARKGATRPKRKPPRRPPSSR